MTSSITPPRSAPAPLRVDQTQECVQWKRFAGTQRPEFFKASRTHSHRRHDDGWTCMPCSRSSRTVPTGAVRQVDVQGIRSG